MASQYNLLSIWSILLGSNSRNKPASVSLHSWGFKYRVTRIEGLGFKYRVTRIEGLGFKYRVTRIEGLGLSIENKDRGTRIQV